MGCACSSWSRRTLSRWTGTWRRSRNGRRSSASCRTRCSGTFRPSSRSRWTSSPPCTRRRRRRPCPTSRGRWCVCSHVGDTDCSLTRTGLADPCVAAQKIEVAHHLCGQPQVPDVTRRVLVSRAARCGDRFIIAIAATYCVLYHDVHDIDMLNGTIWLPIQGCHDRTYQTLPDSEHAARRRKHPPS